MSNILRSTAKRALAAVAARYGYDLAPQGSAPIGYAAFLGNCKRAGLAPATVFDIGVGRGTPWLYEAFPEARLILFEALDDFEPDLQRICATRNAEYHLTALGAAPGSAEIRIPNVKTGASLKERTPAWQQRVGTAAGETRRTIRVDTLDRYEERYPGPFVIKLDVEGFEQEVLQGGRRALTRTDLILAEAAVIPRHVGDTTIASLAACLSDLGFDLLDLVECSQTGLGRGIAFVDLALARRGSDLQRRYWDL